MKKKSIYCLIPARSGSKRIKDKNIIKINNKPLIHYALKAACKAKFIDRVYVATNSQKISKITLKIKNKKIKIFKRSKYSETDHAKTEIVVSEFLKKNRCDILILLQLTNIFIAADELDKAIKKFIQNRYDSMISLVKFDKFIWKKKSNKIIPINYNPRNRPRSQNFKNYFVENGSFYIFKSKKFLKIKNRINGKLGYYEMGKKSFYEIDDKKDLQIVKKLKNS